MLRNKSFIFLEVKKIHLKSVANIFKDAFFHDVHVTTDTSIYSAFWLLEENFFHL